MDTNIPVKDSIAIMAQHFRKQGIHNDVIQEFETLIKEYSTDNLCVFRKKTYRFPDVLPVGCPPSTIVTEAYISNLKDAILSLF